MRRAWEQIRRDEGFRKYVDTELRRPKFTPGGGEWTDSPPGQIWLPLPSLPEGIESDFEPGSEESGHGIAVAIGAT